MNNESSPKCPQCGTPLPEDAPKGLCPNCLMALNLKTETVFTDDTTTAQPPLPPEQIAPHFPQLEILECLGRGGMGVVYKARQKTLNRLVALKLLAPERVNDTKFAERFTREAQALAALNHPNIVTIYDFGQAGGFYFLLMEFVDGLNLRQLLRARKFTPEEALAIVPSLCDALQFAHDRGIVHRDIKPENLLLDKTGRVKVADFGIAKMLGTANGGNGGGTAAPENATQTAVGTPSYSAPEQKTDPQHVDSRADIYSLGVVFYEMLTGELPGKRIAPPSTKVQIDVRLDEIVLRALEKNPDLRYQQVSEVKTGVETIAATPPKSSRREGAQSESGKSSESLVTSTATKSPLRNGALTGFIAFLVIVVLAIGVTLILPRTFVGVARVQLADDNTEHIQTECAEIQSSDCLRKVISDLKLAERWNKKYGVPANNEDQIEKLLRSKIDVQPVRNTSLAGIWVYDEHGGEAADIANTLAEAYCALHGGEIIDRAILPLKPIRPNVLLNIFIGVLLGLGFGVFTGIVVGLFSFWRMRKASPPLIQKPDRFWRWFAVAVFAMIAIPFLISIIGLLAAIAIPNFVKARAQSQANAQLAAQMLAKKNLYSGSASSFYIGQTNFPQGDSIEITSVERDENQMTVKGHYNLISHDKAVLALNITTTNDTSTPMGLEQEMDISNGRGAFELTHLEPAPGLPHINMYAANGKPFAELYFGTKLEAAVESKFELHGDESFRPVIEQTLVDQMAIDFDSGRVVPDSWKEAQRNGFNEDHVAYMKLVGLDAIVGLDTPVLQIVPKMIHDKPRPMLLFIEGMKMEKLVNSCWDGMSVLQLKRFLETVETNSLPLRALGNLSETNLPATYGFETRDGNYGILQITGFTSDNPPAMKISYKLVQNGGSNAVTTSEAEQNANQEIASLKLQQAEKDVKDAEARFSVGTITEYELQKIKLARDIAAAEVKGDNAEVARLKLAAAELELDVAGKRLAIGKATQQEYEQAKLARDIAAASPLVQDVPNSTVLQSGTTVTSIPITLPAPSVGVDYTVAAVSNANDGSNATVIQAFPPPTNLSFSPVVERTIYDYKSGKDWLLNFKTGETFSLPPGLSWDKNSSAVLEWLHQYGIHILGFTAFSQHWHGDPVPAVVVLDQSYGFPEASKRGLFGFEMQAAIMQAQGLTFETITPQQISNALQKLVVPAKGNNIGPFLPQFAGMAWHDTAWHGTDDYIYAFQTDDGQSGVLQITGFTENPRGVKIRYKLMQQTGQEHDNSNINRAPDLLDR